MNLGTRRISLLFRCALLAAALAVLAACAGALIRPASGAADGEEFRVVQRLRVAVLDVTWSPDGRYLLTSNNFARGSGYALWDPFTGRRVRDLASPFGVRHIAVAPVFTPDGTHVLAPAWHLPGETSDVAIAVLNVVTGSVDATVLGPPGRPNNLVVDSYAISAASGRLAVMFDNTIAIYDTATWQLRGTWQPDPSLGVFYEPNIVFDSSGRWLALAGKERADYRGDPLGLVAVFDAETGAVVRTIGQAHLRAVDRLAFLGPTGALVTTADRTCCLGNVAAGRLEPVLDDDPVRVWRGTDGAKVNSFVVDFSRAQNLIATANGRFLGMTAFGRAGEPNRFHLWEFAGAAVRSRTLEYDGYSFRAAAFSPDGRHVALGRSRGRSGPVDVLVVQINQ